MQAIQCYDRALAKMALRALYFEVKAYPKPGLVSFIDSGAHKDMNGVTFHRSLFALRHYFYQIAKQGTVNESFYTLKNTGIMAEQTMLKKTGGINTHRGAIFALGLICVSAARLNFRQTTFTPSELHQQLLIDWQIPLAEHSVNPHSHGGIVRQHHKVMDALQVAMQGYAVIFELLPGFIRLFANESLDHACLFAYLELLIKIDDTNILYKKGKLGLNYAKNQAAEILAVTCLKTRREKALIMHQVFSEQGLSPGGVADLIAALLFVGQLFCEQLRCHY